MTNPDERRGSGNATADRNWQHTYELLSADRAAPLEPHDLERLGMAAYFIGRDVEAADVLAQAHQAFLTGRAPRRAIRTAFWLAFILMNTGEGARSAGWLARAERLLKDAGGDCVERGYLLVPAGVRHIRSGALAAGAATFAEAVEIGERFGDPDLVNLARQGQGRALIALGEIARGTTLLDEVMVAVTSGELSPIVSGTIYCSVISACFDMFDIRRAHEWTEALNHWCASQPDLVPYRGECLVQRAEIMRLHGIWPDALEEARRACECLAQTPRHPSIGAAHYQVAELHRLRGESAKAEAAYAAAGEAGRTPHPGLALLRLAQGRTDAAKAAISRAVEEARDRRTRSRMLAAGIEILLAAGDVAEARAAADELSAIAAAVDTPFLRAMALQGAGAVQLAEGDAKNALTSLREACTLWRDLSAPYEGARATLLVALARRALGDADSALMELNAARQAFARLGAAADLARLGALTDADKGGAAGQLTVREMQVLKLIASGKTNRAIADELGISEKTVARHVSNIFTKLDLSSRAAATAYAFKHNFT